MLFSAITRSHDKSNDNESPNLQIQSSKVAEIPGPKDISMSKDRHPVQPCNIKFPSHMIGKQYRAFTSSLYDKYSWIEYSQCEDAIYCYHCRHFSKNRKEHTFVTQGMRNWKKCYGTRVSDNKLMQHQGSLQHAECVDAYARYLAMKSGAFQSVAELQDSAHVKLIKENKQYMRTLCEVLLVTAQRKIAQRETGRSFRVDNINEESLDFGPSCGNFLAILSLVANHDPVVAERIRSGPMNAKYTHHSVQNALLGIMKDMILEQIKEELHEAEYFTILADESKDTSKKEQVVAAVRYCFNNAIHEEFIGVAEAQSLDADGLSDTIIYQLRRVDANMKNCVGQGYDGASVVSGHLNGVQRKIPEKTGAEMAYYVHCFCHRLNLVIVDVVNSVKCVANMIALFKQLHSFLSSSTVHVRWEKLQENNGVKKMEIGKVSDTRWSCQAKQFNAVSKRIDIVYEVLQDVIDNDSNANRITEATGYMLQIDRRFVRYLLVTKHILKKAKFASDMLQKPTNDLTEAMELIGTLKDEMKACRSREKCQEFWDDAEKVADRLNLPESARPIRRRRLPVALQDCVVEANVEENAAGVGFDGYVRDVYEIVDKLMGSFRRDSMTTIL